MGTPVRRCQWVQALILITGLAAGIFPFAGVKGIAPAVWSAAACAGLARWRRGWPFTARLTFRRELECIHVHLDLPAVPEDDGAADPPD